MSSCLRHCFKYCIRWSIFRIFSMRTNMKIFPHLHSFLKISSNLAPRNKIKDSINRTLWIYIYIQLQVFRKLNNFHQFIPSLTHICILQWVFMLTESHHPYLKHWLTNFLKLFLSSPALSFYCSSVLSSLLSFF